MGTDIATNFLVDYKKFVVIQIRCDQKISHLNYSDASECNIDQAFFVYKEHSSDLAIRISQ